MDNEAKKVVKTFFDGFPLTQYRKGQIILRPEEDLTSVFYLISGQVVQYDISSAGNEVVVNAFKPGSFFPMSQAINRTTNYYFFEAATPIETRQAPVADVIELLKQYPEVTFDLLRRIYIGTDGLVRRMAHLMGGKTKSRLIFELLNAAYRFGKKNPDGSVFISLTELDLSKRSGLSRETISRAMQDLKANRCVSVRRQGILVLDPTRLEEMIGHEL